MLIVPCNLLVRVNVSVLVPILPITVIPLLLLMLDDAPKTNILLAVGGTAPPLFPVNVSTGEPPPPPPDMLIMPACEITHLCCYNILSDQIHISSTCRSRFTINLRTLWQ